MLTEPGPLNLRLGAVGMTCKVHPTVLVTICDSYIRRPAGATRVIGTLLGNVSGDDSIVVKACYAVPHEEDAEQVWPFYAPCLRSCSVRDLEHGAALVCATVLECCACLLLPLSTRHSGQRGGAKRTDAGHTVPFQAVLHSCQFRTEHA